MSTMSDDLEVLIQRFLDAELTRSERLDLLRRMSDDALVRGRVLAAEGLLDVAARLPRPAVPVDFVARTMQRLPKPERFDERPARPAPLRWRFLPLAAAAALLMALTFWIGREQGVRTTRAQGSQAEQGTAHEVLVRLVLIEPGAREVTVVGDFNGWDPGKTPLERTASGVFRVTLPLKAGRYHYMFVVDGREWLADPLASETSLDGFGSHNSVLDVQT